MIKSGPIPIKVSVEWKNEINLGSIEKPGSQLDRWGLLHPPFGPVHQMSSKSHISLASPTDLLPSHQHCSFLRFHPSRWLLLPLPRLPRQITNRIAIFSCPTTCATRHTRIFPPDKVSAQVWHVHLWPPLCIVVMPKSVLNRLSKLYEQKRQ